jgi:acyl-CoA synthetase (AMP-forming)/AMP-acid ligase II
MRWESHQMFLERFQPYNFRSEALGTCYAMAENVFAVTQGGIHEPVKIDEIESDAFTQQNLAIPASEGRTIRMISAGRSISNTKVRILEDRDSNHARGIAKRKELPDRHIGEIALFSDCMLTGYYNREDLTQRAFYEGWYLTGDLGYTVDGEVYVIGRKKDLIIVGGKNIYPQDLESIANQVPGVHRGRVVAFGLFNPEIGTEEVVMVVEVDDPQLEARQQIADLIRRRVTKESAIALRQVQIVDPKWIIKTSSGKTARRANRDKYLKSFPSS